MRQLIWSNSFTRLLKKTIRKRPKLRQDIEDTLKLLVQDPFAPQFYSELTKEQQIAVVDAIKEFMEQ